MGYEIAGVPLLFSGDAAYLLRGALSAYEADVSCGGVSVSCGVCGSLPLLPAREVYGVRGRAEQYLLSDEGPAMQLRSQTTAYAQTLFAPDFSSARCTLADTRSDSEELLARHMLFAVGRCFSSCLPSFGAVTYHASCIRYRGDALLFCAPSGTGKSTQTALWERCFPGEVEYINDDTPILRERGGAFWACGSPWAGTSGINNNISAPVRAIFCLERAEENSIIPLTREQALDYAMRSARVQFFPAQREKQTRLLLRLAAAAQFYLLRCTPTEEAVKTVKSFLYNN